MKPKFELKENVPLVVKKKRNVPFCIIKIDQWQAWQTRKTRVFYLKLTIAIRLLQKKKNSEEIRVCVDFSMGLNDDLKNYPYSFPRRGEVFVQLSRDRIFSKIDISDAYIQIKVDDEFSKLLTIKTHRGIFKSHRLAFGKKITPAIFQRVMDMMLSGLEFTVTYLYFAEKWKPRRAQKLFSRFLGLRTMDSSRMKKNANFLSIRSNICDKYLIKTAEDQIQHEPVL